MIGTKIISPLPDPTLKERGVSLLKGLSKNLLYNPDTRRVLPQSMFYADNLPQVKNGRLDPENMQKAIQLVSGISMTGGIRPVRPIPMGGIQKTVLNARDVATGQGKRMIPTNTGWKIDQRFGKQFQSASSLRK